MKGPKEADVVRWFIYVSLGLMGLLFVAIVAVYLLVGHFNLASLASGRASAALGRQVTIDALHISPGRWIDGSQLRSMLRGWPMYSVAVAR